MRRLSVLLTLLGVAGAAALVLHFDPADVIGAMLSVGWHGFAVLLLWQGLLFVLLGLAWASVLPGISVPLLIWGRMVRDGATTCLPFSPVGGYVIAARAVTLQGAPWAAAAAGTVVDVTAEIVAQLLFSLFGVCVLALARPGSGLAGPLAITFGVSVLLALAVFRARRQIGDVLETMGGRLLGDWFRAHAETGERDGGIERLRVELRRLYADRRRLALATALHLLAWFAAGFWTWLALWLLGHRADVLGILALEALLDMVIGAAFIVPAAAGVQEAGLVGLGAVFGVPPDLALSVSLLRRAKDIGWGLPVLGTWQLLEVRRL